MRELATRTEEAERRSAKLAEEQVFSEGQLPILREDLRESDEALESQRSGVRALEEALRTREQSVAAYEIRAGQLQFQLRNVLGELRTSYEDAQRERVQLEAHVASLERAKSPRVAAAQRIRHHAPLLESGGQLTQAELRRAWRASLPAESPPDSTHRAEVVEQLLPPPTRRHWQPLPPRAAVREAERLARERRASLTERQARQASAMLKEAPPWHPPARSSQQAIRSVTPTEPTWPPSQRTSLAGSPMGMAASGGVRDGLLLQEDNLPDHRWSYDSDRSQASSPAAPTSKASLRTARADARRERSSPVEMSSPNSGRFSPVEVRNSTLSKRQTCPAEDTADGDSDSGSYWMDFSTARGTDNEAF